MLTATCAKLPNTLKSPSKHSACSAAWSAAARTGDKRLQPDLAMREMVLQSFPNILTCLGSLLFLNKYAF